MVFSEPACRWSQRLEAVAHAYTRIASGSECGPVRTRASTKATLPLALLARAARTDPPFAFSIGVRMLSFFSGGKPKSPVAPARASTDADGSAVGEVLSRAEAKLQQLRTSGGQDFPLLNEATRLGTHLTGTCL